MSFMALDRERLWILYRRLDDLENALARIRRAASASESAAIRTDLRDLDDACSVCANHRARVLRVLKSGVLDETSVRHEHVRLRSWIETHPSWWAKATHGDPTEIDSILRAVGSDPRAAGTLADRTEFVAPLLYGAHDTEAVRNFWMMVTDPSITPPEIAGRRIRALLETVFGEHSWSHGPSLTSIDPVERRRIESAVRDMLGAIVAPWQFTFTGRAASWSWSSEEGVVWLRRVAESAQAAADLSRGLGPALVESLSHLPEDPRERRELIDEVALGIGASLQVLQEAGIDDAGRDQSTWRTFDQLVKIAPVNMPWPVSILVDRGATWLDDRLSDGPTIADHGVALTGQRMLAGLAVLTVWRSYWSQPSKMRSPEEMDRELRHTYDAIDAPSTRGRIIASRR